MCKIWQNYEPGSNEYKILLNGLFMLAHEMPGRVNWPPPAENAPEINQMFSMIDKAELEMKSHIGERTGQRPWWYKQEYRDWEYILRNVHDGDATKPLLPMITFDEKNKLQRPFPFAVNPSDQQRVIVATPENMKNITTYLDAAGQKNIPSSFNQASIYDARRERDSLVEKALRDGYERFWAYFRALIKNKW